jgi:hypothetical protein
VDKAKPFSISKWEVWESYKRVKANKGAAGVDGQSIAAFEEDFVNCRHNRAGVFAVMEPVQSAQKTVSDTSFKTSYSPPLRVSLFYFCTTL